MASLSWPRGKGEHQDVWKRGMVRFSSSHEESLDYLVIYSCGECSKSPLVLVTMVLDKRRDSSPGHSIKM